MIFNPSWEPHLFDDWVSRVSNLFPTNTTNTMIQSYFQSFSWSYPSHAGRDNRRWPPSKRTLWMREAPNRWIDRVLSNWIKKRPLLFFRNKVMSGGDDLDLKMFSSSSVSFWFWNERMLLIVICCCYYHQLPMIAPPQLSLCRQSFAMCSTIIKTRTFVYLHICKLCLSSYFSCVIINWFTHTHTHTHARMLNLCSLKIRIFTSAHTYSISCPHLCPFCVHISLLYLSSDCPNRANLISNYLLIYAHSQQTNKHTYTHLP